MQFLFPWFIAAGLALAVPIIIHLYHFRRYRKVRFTNLRFLKQVEKETSNRARLRNLLILALRCLAILGLVFAFMQPFIPGDQSANEGRTTLSIFVDNSYSMSALSSDKVLLEQAKARAKQIVAAFYQTDKFQILTNDFEGRHQRLVGKEDALAFIDEIRPTPTTKTVSQINARQNQLLRQSDSPNKRAYIISDFQETMADLTSVTDTLTTTFLLPLQAVELRNVSLDTAWFESPVQVLNRQSNLLVKVTNHGDRATGNVRLSLVEGNQNKAVGSIDIPAGSSVTDTIMISPTSPGWHKAMLHVSDYPIQFDDTMYVAYQAAQDLPVLLLTQGAPNRFLDAAMNSLAGFKTDRQTAGSVDYSSLSKYKLILLQDLTSISSGLASELAQYAKSGGNVLIFPPSGADINSYNTFMQSVQGSPMGGFESRPREVSQINTDHFLFSDVYLNKNSNLRLPKTQGNYALRNAGARGGEYLLTYRDGSPFLVNVPVLQGNVILCAAPLDETYSNLTTSGEVFVPLLYKAALAGDRGKKIAYTIGTDDYIEADNRLRTGGNDLSYKLKGRSGEFIPDQRTVGSKVAISIDRQLDQAGFYDLYLRQDSTLMQLGFNYDRRESVQQFLDDAALTKILPTNFSVMSAANQADLTGALSNAHRGTSFWRWCLWIVLAALLVETLLLRFWKV
jgi:Aerotolerance regulator N-terminal